jgi:hypothetical protein
VLRRARVDDRGMDHDAARRSTRPAAKLLTPILFIAAIAVVLGESGRRGTSDHDAEDTP